MIGPVSVVVPAYNAGAELGCQLEALSRQTFRGDFEVVVADNGSTDYTADVVARWQARTPCLRLVDASRRRGAGAARNIGADHARGALLAFCDADDVVEPAWLDALVAGATPYDITGGCLDMRVLNAPTLPVATEFHLLGSLPRALQFLPYAFSGNCAVRTDVFRSLGGFNERYPYVEDIELSWRAQVAGYRVGHARGAVVRYRLKNDPRTATRSLFRYGRVSAQLFCDFHRHGMPRSSARSAVKSWAWAGSCLPALWMADSDERWLWRRRVALRAGRLIGSVEQRVVYL